jgi:tetratricopeptide (TPR) repeat protein
LTHLQAAEFLYETSLFPNRVYTFKHALTHEVAYGSLLQERRRTLHAHIVEALETLGGEDQIERLAYHALRGEAWEKAVSYYRQAGTKAVAHSANREAVACYEQALVALDHLPEHRDTLVQAIDLRLDLRMALLPLGEVGRIHDLLQEAELLAKTLNDPSRLGWLSTLMGHYYWQIGEASHALAYCQRAVELLTSTGDVSLQVLAQFCLSEVYISLGDYYRAIDILQRNVAVLDTGVVRERFGGFAVGPGLQSVASRRWLVLALAEVGAYAEALTRGEEAVRLAEADEHPYSLSLAYGGIGRVSLRRGDVHQAMALLHRSLEMCRAWDIKQHVPGHAVHLSLALALSGQVPEALALIAEIGEASLTRQADRLLPVNETYLLAGHIDHATQLALHTLDLVRQQKARGSQAWVLRLLGDIAMHRNPPDVKEAETSYQQALTLAEELGMRPLQAHCHRGLGTVYSQTGRSEHARAALSTAIEMYRDMAMTFWLPETQAVLADVEGRA